MRLGFIAMSGVRVENTELKELGLTMPGVMERSKVVASLPSLALLTLAGLTPEDFDCQYVEVPDISLLEGLPGEFDAVAIASYTAQIKDAYKLAQRYRDCGTKVILGGLHVTAMPEEAEQYADAVILGEAECVWLRCIEDLKRNTLQKRYDARNSVFDLRNAPMPRFELLDPGYYNRITVQTQRGCPLSCEFCASSIRISPKFKTKPVELVIAEIRKIKEIWSNPFIEFADDNTFANKAHGKRLLRELVKENIRWFTETDISVGDDDDLLSLLRDAGCAQLLIGFEAPDKPALQGLETKTDWKARRADTYLEAIHKIQSYGITVNGCFILGLDNQTEDSFDDVIRYVQNSGLYEVQVTVQTPFPGTPLYMRLALEGRLLEHGAWEKCTLFDVTYEPRNMSSTVLRERFNRMVAEIYSPQAVRKRRGDFLRSRAGMR